MNDDAAPPLAPSPPPRPRRPRRDSSAPAPRGEEPSGDRAHGSPEASPKPRDKRFRNLVAQVGFIGLATVTVFGFVRAAKSDHLRSVCSSTCALGPSYAGRNRVAPDFTLPDLDGNQVSLASYRGQIVVLNFWASWCDPCREEMPSLAKLAAALEGRKDVALLTISVDEDLAQARDTLSALFLADEELKKKLPPKTIPFRVLLDPELKVVGELFGTTKYPETWILDREGVIRARFDGSRDWAGARAFGVIDSVDAGPGCLADFQEGKPVGPFAQLCSPD